MTMVIVGLHPFWLSQRNSFLLSPNLSALCERRNCDGMAGLSVVETRVVGMRVVEMRTVAMRIAEMRVVEMRIVETRVVGMRIAEATIVETRTAWPGACRQKSMSMWHRAAAVPLDARRSECDREEEERLSLIHI
eukprot:1217614-Rhodomonas_salina.1